MVQSHLLQNLCGYIDGQWVGAAASKTFEVCNPATGDLLAVLPNLGAPDTRAAVVAADRAWRDFPSLETREGWLMAIHDALLREKQELARIITLEQGKPLKESLVEVDYSAGFFKFFASQIHNLAPSPLGEKIRGASWTVHHRPAGAVGLITPWNFPLAMLAKKFPAALAAGCGIVTKPADLTPLTTIALWHILDGLKLPPGVANLVIGDAAPIGDVLCTHPAVRLISFTGSTEVGRTLIKTTAPHIKRLSLELGGNAPYIVMDDADLTAAADALMANKFRCAGQTCVCANRILVHAAVADRFASEMARRVSALRVGNGMDASTEIGPLINRAAVEKVARHVEDAMACGAKRVAQASVDASLTGTFYPPTLLDHLAEGSAMQQEETFGPIVAIRRFETEAEAVALANSTIYGLAAYLFTADVSRIERMSRQLSFGHVAVNTGTGPTPEAPFGGMKQSGYG
ncbi:MAG TPA: aldehyde dehydrogenase family protein, partial [Tepidisphaeraceae bacterium]|nr:aldehyde dehydrogenase family protein [Tepidisphaeraceae bacterium]